MNAQGQTGRADAVLIAGPTASGKSALALAVAERMGGMVVNADSMQVYATLQVLTARPGDEDLARAPHRLYGHVSPAQRYSVGRYLEDAEAVLQEAADNQLLPVFVGGTGLYFKALVEGLSPIPPVPDEVRMAWSRRLETEGAGALRSELETFDPQLAARVGSLDGQRLVRALSVAEATGKPLSHWQAQPGRAIVDVDRAECVFLDPDREALYRRIDTRFERMIAHGALDEVRRLVEIAPDSSLPARRAHGAPHLAAHLAGECDLEEAVRRAQADTRHYAKRQKTWFRHQMTGWTVLDPDDATARETWLESFSA